MKNRPEITNLLSLSVEKYIVGVFVPDGKHYSGDWYDLKSARRDVLNGSQ